jgi:uncharacterized membrane protein
MRKTIFAVIGLIFLSFILSIYFYSHIPEQMATHWNSQGEVSGHMSKLYGLFLMPLIITGISVMFQIIPKIDPLKENIEKFSNYYDRFIIILILFLVVVQVHVLLWNVGIRIKSNVLFPIGLGLLFYYGGILIENAERNWFIGIKTPWPLSSDGVWKKTNRIGGSCSRSQV